MNKYLLDLINAFKDVTIENYNWNAVNKENRLYEQQCENNFTSEIITNLRILMRKPQNETKYQNLKCHFDVLKNRVAIQPDIVLHESPENQNQQIYYCEVKISKNSDLREDLEKIKIAISEELNFQNGVMIVANKKLEATEKQIRKYLQNDTQENIKKIILLHASIENGELKHTIKNFTQIIS